MDIVHSKSVLVTKGMYKGYFGEARNFVNKKYIVNVMNKDIAIPFDFIFFMDMRYESNDKKGFIQIVSIKNNTLTGLFKNDIVSCPIEQIILNRDDKNIKENFVNKFVEKNHQEEEMFIEEEECNFVNSYNNIEHTEMDDSEMEANDKMIYVKISDIMKKLIVHEKMISYYKVINHYNFIMDCYSKNIIENRVKLDCDIILCNIIFFELMKSMDISILYSEYKGTNGFQKYFNMLKDKLIYHINDCDFELSKFNVSNLQKYFGMQFMKPHKNKLYEICYNIFRYIKHMIPMYNANVMPFQLTEEEKYIPLGNHMKNKLYFDSSSSINEVIKQENMNSIEELKNKIKIAEATNNIDLLQQLQSKLKEANKKIKKTYNSKKISLCKNFDDCFYNYIDTLKMKLDNAIKINHKDNIKSYKFVIEHLSNTNVNDVLIKKHRDILKNNYASIYETNMIKEKAFKSNEYKHFKDKYNKWYNTYFDAADQINNDIFEKHFYNKLKNIERQIANEKQKMIINNERQLLQQMKNVNINNDENNDNIENDNDIDNDMFGDYQSDDE